MQFGRGVSINFADIIVEIFIRLNFKLLLANLKSGIQSLLILVIELYFLKDYGFDRCANMNKITDDGCIDIVKRKNHTLQIIQVICTAYLFYYVPI